MTDITLPLMSLLKKPNSAQNWIAWTQPRTSTANFEGMCLLKWTFIFKTCPLKFLITIPVHDFFCCFSYAASKLILT
ncbi:hypothetical protein ES332_A10G115600v1 [Gossypium tomentosum]|uniref:Uncharacterized protein n=1 Tax=Gossypium tomentosum TaxID=34277 RepID=A0A5D2NPH0_GOSTO|nr:hypothetical protein ES332_A10G115600v1 [Gossypium tomentosum]